MIVTGAGSKHRGCCKASNLTVIFGHHDGHAIGLARLNVSGHVGR